MKKKKRFKKVVEWNNVPNLQGWFFLILFFFNLTIAIVWDNWFNKILNGFLATGILILFYTTEEYLGMFRIPKRKVYFKEWLR